VQGTLSPALAARGMRLHVTPEPEVIYYYLNFGDPVVGGNDAHHRALRRAIVRAFDVRHEIRMLREGVGNVAHTPLPPGVFGHALARWDGLGYDVDAANRLLDEAGFLRGADGWRSNPDGSPLLITFSSEPLDVVRPFAELRQQSLAAIGLRSTLRQQSFADNVRDSQRCGLAFWGSTWRAVIPTELYFLQLLYGPNAERGLNLACYRSAEFDRRFEAARRLPPGARRNALVREMLHIVEHDAVWQLGVNRAAVSLVQPHVRGFQHHPMLHNLWSLVRLAASAGASTQEAR
jgi:oligopeptide transport system substrate-binding protein